MLRFLLLRLARALLTIALVVSFAFVVLRLSGDPALLIMCVVAPPEAVAAFRKAWGLDEPLWQQYLSYFGAIASGTPAWLDPESNDYYRRPGPDGVPPESVGFRGWYGWGDDGRLLEAGGSRYLLAVMLGVTAGRGNTVRELATYLERAAAADGTKPKGTIYLMTNGDVRTTTRSGPFPAIVKELTTLGVKAEIASGTLPQRKRDVAGLMTGTPSFDWATSGSTILPGAICENLTSFGGIFTPSAGQTPLSDFLRAGAAGSSGTVVEPYSIQAKFPHPSIHVHYCRGASLVEAFYQSVSAP
jgi:hypothetical protein